MNEINVSYMDGQQWQTIEQHYNWLGNLIEERRYMQPSEYREVLKLSVDGLVILGDSEIHPRQYKDNMDLARKLTSILEMEFTYIFSDHAFKIYKYIGDIRFDVSANDSYEHIRDDEYYRKTLTLLNDTVDFLNNHIEIYLELRNDENRLW